MIILWGPAIGCADTPGGRAIATRYARHSHHMRNGMNPFMHTILFLWQLPQNIAGPKIAGPMTCPQRPLPYRYKKIQ